MAAHTLGNCPQWSCLRIWFSCQWHGPWQDWHNARGRCQFLHQGQSLILSSFLLWVCHWLPCEHQASLCPRRPKCQGTCLLLLLSSSCSGWPEFPPLRTVKPSGETPNIFLVGIPNIMAHCLSQRANGLWREPEGFSGHLNPLCHSGHEVNELALSDGCELSPTNVSFGWASKALFPVSTETWLQLPPTGVGLFATSVCVGLHHQ